MIYLLNFRLIIERWTFKTSKLNPIAATNARAVDNFNAKKIKLKIAIQIQKTAILTKNRISLALLRRVPTISKASSLIRDLPSFSFGIIIAYFRK